MTQQMNQRINTGFKDINGREIFLDDHILTEDYETGRVVRWQDNFVVEFEDDWGYLHAFDGNCKILPKNTFVVDDEKLR